MSFINKALLVFAIATLIFFGNRAFQSYLGNQAQSQLAFEIYDLKNGLERAAETQKPIIADYSAFWCPSCRKLDEQVFANDKVADLIKQHFIFVSIDHDSQTGHNFAKQHELVGFPRVLILSHESQKITELPLSFDPDQYYRNLQRVLLAQSE
uniref:thioredoxin family protein n=1 Tax=Ningiella ruwaisensis TaxID=2364274 RepID=UPI0010A01061|nr:thioredoxin family protein [Ningiella ruwaisensis]